MKKCNHKGLWTVNVERIQFTTRMVSDEERNSTLHPKHFIGSGDHTETIGTPDYYWQCVGCGHKESEV